MEGGAGEWQEAKGEGLLLGMDDHSHVISSKSRVCITLLCALASRMPLYSNGSELHIENWESFSFGAFAAAIGQDEDCQARTEDFVWEQPKQVQSTVEEVCVYVNQGEYGRIVPSDHAVIGSDAAATNCLVAIVVEGCSVSFGHIDSGTPALLLHMARDAETVGSGDVYIAGSFDDEGSQSLETVRDCLHLLQQSPAKLHIRLAAVLSFNTAERETDGIKVPRVHSMALRCGPTEEPFPAIFPDKGPVHPLRASRFLTNHEPIDSARCCWAGDGSRSFIIPRWPLEVDSSVEMTFCAQVKSLPDEAILMLWSTAPEAEGKDFVATIRAVAEYLCSHFCADDVWGEDIEGIRFIWETETGDWKQIEWNAAWSADAVGPLQSTPHGGPDTWQQLTTHDDKVYFINTNTGHGRWSQP